MQNLFNCVGSEPVMHFLTLGVKQALLNMPAQITPLVETTATKLNKLVVNELW